MEKSHKHIKKGLVFLCVFISFVGVFYIAIGYIRYSSQYINNEAKKVAETLEDKTQTTDVETYKEANEEVQKQNTNNLGGYNNIDNQSTSLNNSRLYYNEQYHFSIEFPPNWDIYNDNDLGNQIVQAASYGLDSIVIHVSPTVDFDVDGIGDGKEFVDGFKELNDKNETDYDYGFITINNNKAFYIGYSHDYKAFDMSATIYTKMIMFSYNSMGYTIECNYILGDSVAEASIIKSIKSFKFMNNY